MRPRQPSPPPLTTSTTALAGASGAAAVDNAAPDTAAMYLSRKSFLLRLAGGAWALSVAGCGGGGDDDAPPAAQCSATIEGNHGHTLVIPPADLDATSPRTYDITGSSGHAHTVTFSAAQLAALKAGSPVSVTSSLGAGHSHAISERCT